MNYQNAGSFVAELRKSKNISGRGLAAAIGITPPALRGFECGEGRLKEENLVKIAEIFDINKDLLLGMAGKIASDVREIILAEPIGNAERVRDFRRNAIRPAK